MTSPKALHAQSPGSRGKMCTQAETSAMSRTDDAISIEEYLAQCENHYGAYPHIGVLPFQPYRPNSDASCSKLYRHQEVQDFIHSTLQQHSMLFRRIGFYNREASYADGPRVLPCFCFDVSGDNTDSASCRDVAKAIYNCINTFDKDLKCDDGTEDFFVEVYDSKKENDLTVYPCPSSIEDSSLSIFRTQAFEKAGELLRPNFVAAGVYLMREPSSTSDPVPTIGIWIKENTVADFHNINLQLKDIGRRLSSAAQLRLIRTASVKTYPANLGKDYLNHVLAAGDSIGAVGSDDVGSLGGYMRFITGEGQSVPVFMTSAHVVQPPDKAKAEHLVEHGFSQGAAQKIDIHYPTKCDLKGLINSIEFNIFYEERAIAEARDAEELNGLQRLTSSQQRAIQEHPTSIQRHKNKIEEINAMISGQTSMVVGSVIHASPLVAGRSGNLMDWALVEVRDKTSIQPNKAPDEVHSPPYNNYMPYMYWPSRPVEYIEHVTKDQHLIMKGRRSGTVTGHVNGYITEVEWDGRPDKRTLEWQVFSGDSKDRNDPHYPTFSYSINDTTGCPFGRADDSGAWVYDSEGSLVGMYCGRLEGLGLVTPIEDIIRDIRKRIGGDVVLSPSSDQSVPGHSRDWSA